MPKLRVRRAPGAPVPCCVSGPVRRWAAVLAAWAIVGGLACSPGENSVLNPATNRGGLTSLPETLSLGTASADRSYRAQLVLGSLGHLRVGRSDSVETVAFLRFAAFTDTADLTGAQVGLRWAGGAGSDLRLEAYEVTGGDLWTESSLRAQNMPPLSDTPLYVNPDPLRPRDDTTLVRAAVRISPEVIRRWARDPDANRGIALRLTAASPPGELRFLAREAVIDADSTVSNPQIEYLRENEVVSTAAAVADAFIYRDLRPPIAGDDSTLTLAEWLPTRALYRFDVEQALRAQTGLDPRRLTINRAQLRLRVAAWSGEGASHGLTTHRVLTDWTEETEPDSIALSAAASTSTVGAALDSVNSRLSVEVGPIVRDWAGGDENRGLALRLLGEVTGDVRLNLASREAAESARPELVVVFTRPPDPRWEEDPGHVEAGPVSAAPDRVPAEADPTPAPPDPSAGGVR